MLRYLTDGLSTGWLIKGTPVSAVKLEPNATHYMAYNKTTGEVTARTDRLHWDAEGYQRLYRVTTGAKEVASWEDFLESDSAP